MKNLTLSIQRDYFDDILNGDKKKEYREIKPTTSKNYIEFDEEGEKYINGKLVPIKYDTITLYTGQYKAKRPGIVVECLGATTKVNKKNTYEYEGKEYYEAVIIYKLGNILEKLNFENLTPRKESTVKFMTQEEFEKAEAVFNIVRERDKPKMEERNNRLNALVKTKWIN